MYRKIALLDLDAFYASCETLKNPKLQNIPFAVGGKSKRSVVCTCNYLARNFGVRSAQSIHKSLQLCPQLTIVKVDMPFYKEMSKKIHNILKNYTDLVEAASIDEFYLDLSDNREFSGSASLTMEQIRTDIRALGVTASAGISSQKMVAKIASDERKPDGQFVVPPEKIFSYLAPLPLKRIPGIGPVTQAKLERNNLIKVEDIQHVDFGFLVHLLGHNMAQNLYSRCQGIDNRKVSAGHIRKSVSVEITLNDDITQLESALSIFEEHLWEDFLDRFQKVDPKMRLHNQTVKLKMHDFSTTTMTKTAHILSKEVFQQLIKDIWPRTKGRSVRLIGIGVGLPEENEKRQLELDFD